MYYLRVGHLASKYPHLHTQLEQAQHEPFDLHRTPTTNHIYIGVHIIYFWSTKSRKFSACTYAKFKQKLI